jgi:hypothetical protein
VLQVIFGIRDLGNPIVVSPAATTVYTVQGNIGSCLSSKTIALTVSACTGINNTEQNNGIKVYPNPTSGLLMINFGETYSGKVSVYNAIGQEVLTKSVHEIEVTNFNLESLANGIYLIKLRTENGQDKVFKILKD